MGYFAKINQRLVVTDVIEATEEYVETLPGNWIETDPSGSFRKNYAGIGYTYDYALDCFCTPNPNNPSASFDPNTCRWNIPVQPTGSVTGSI